MNLAFLAGKVRFFIASLFSLDSHLFWFLTSGIENGQLVIVQIFFKNNELLIMLFMFISLGWLDH